MAQFAPVETYARKADEVDALQFDGSNAAAVKAFTDGFDADAVHILNGVLHVRNFTSDLHPVRVGAWLVASAAVSPQVWMEEPSAMTRKYVKKL